MMMRALPLALSAATRDMRGIYRRAKRNAVLTALAGLCFGVAFLAALMAAGIHLAAVYGPATAALLIAAAMSGAGILLLAVVQGLKYLDRRRHARSRSAQRLTAAAAISLLPRMPKSKGLLAVAALGGLAFLVAQGRGDDD
jgi:hypothetical protein